MNAPLRVLLVEDSEADAELVGIELEKAGFQLQCRRVETEADFLAALQVAEWDLVISDFRMPTFDGLKAFALFQRTELDVPFIFVSGMLGEEQAVEAMRAGARDYLLKGNLARLGVAVTRELREAAHRRQRKLLEEGARRGQRRLAMAVEASGAGVFEHSVPPGPETYLSERFREILGFAEPELPPGVEIVRWIRGLLHPEDLSDASERYRDLVEGRSERCYVEGRIQHRDGRFLDAAVFAKAVESDETGRARSVVGVLVDQSERKRLEAQLRQAQKMEAVGRLAGGVAHDFNNLLTAILSFGELVLAELKPGDTPHQDMQEVLKAARRAEGLASQLLAFSRRKAISPRVIHVNDVVVEMERMLRRILGEDVDLLTTLAPLIGSVRIDPSALEQVLLNLAINARDAMPQGGRLTIETDNATLDDSFTFRHGAEIPPGAYVVVAVSDDGIGMNEETKSRLFEPFFTTKAPGEGTGLGLATCYGIVKQAGGYIWVYSEEGKGTTFRIYLPQVKGAPERAQKPVESEDVHGSEAILIVEDDEQVRKLVVRVLSRLGYRVLEAANGGEAVALCDQTDRIDLVLSDVVMPGLSGKELTERLASVHPGTKVLFMSGYTRNAIAHRGALEPGIRLLQKPFTPESLARAVRDALDG